MPLDQKNSSKESINSKRERSYLLNRDDEENSENVASVEKKRKVQDEALWTVEFPSSDEKTSSQNRILELMSKVERNITAFSCKLKLKITNSTRSVLKTVLLEAGPVNTCIAVDKQLFIFTSMLDAQIASLVLAEGYPVKATFSSDGQFLVVVDSLSRLHFCHSTSGQRLFMHDLGNLQGEIIFAKLLQRGAVSDLIVAVKEEANGKLTFAVFSDLLLDELGNALESGQVPVLKKIQESMKISFFHPDLADNDFELVGVSCRYVACNGTTQAQLAVWGSGAICLAVFLLQVNPQTESFFQVSRCRTVGRDILGADKILEASFAHSNCLLVLTNQAEFVLFDVKLLFIRQVFEFANMRSSKFCLLESADSTKLCVIDMSLEKALYLVDMRHEMQLTHRSSLAELSACELSTDGTSRICLLEQAATSNEVVVRLIYPDSNENRFMELVQEQKYREAASFQQLANLETTDSLKVLLQQALVDLNSGKSTKIADNFDLNELFDALHKVNEKAFIADYCASLHMPTFEATLILLEFGLEFCSSFPNSTELATLQKLLDKLTTFKLLLGNNADLFAAGTWHEFRQERLDDHMIKLVQMELVDKAAIIWKRHALAEWSSGDKLWQLGWQFLVNIPLSSPTIAFSSWFRVNFWPNVVERTHKDMVYGWLARRVESLLAKESKNASRALELFELLAIDKQAQEAAWFSPCTPKIQARRIACFSTDADAASGKYLAELEKQLQDLKYVSNELKMPMSYSEYSKMGPSVIALCLLDRAISVAQLEETVNGLFMDYCARHKLNVEGLLVEYCLDATHQKNIPSSLLWESRVLALLAYIKSADSKLSVIIEASRRSPAPWCSEIDQMLQLGNACKDASCYTEFREHVKLLYMKKMLALYGIQKFNAGNLTLVKMIAQRLAFLIHVPGSFDAALVLASAYHHIQLRDVVTWRLAALSRANLEYSVRSERIASVIEGGTDNKRADFDFGKELHTDRGALEVRLDSGAYVVEDLLGSFATIEKSPFVYDSLEIILQLLATNKRSCFFCQEELNTETLGGIPGTFEREVYDRVSVKAMLRNVKAAKRLFEKFDVCIPPQSLDNPAVGLELFKKIDDSGSISKGKEKIAATPNHSPTNAKARLEIAGLIGKNILEMHQTLAETSADLGNFSAALSHCHHIADDFASFSGAAATLLKCIRHIQGVLAKRPDLFTFKLHSNKRVSESLHSLAKKACVLSQNRGSGILAHAVWTAHVTHWQSLVHSTTDSGYYSDLMEDQAGPKPTLVQTIFPNVYIDSPPILECGKVMPLVSKLCNLLLNCNSNDPQLHSTALSLALELSKLFDSNQNGSSVLRLHMCMLRFLFTPQTVGLDVQLEDRLKQGRDRLLVRQHYIENERSLAVTRRANHCLRVLSVGVVDQWLALALLVPLPPNESISVIARGMNSVPVTERDNDRAVMIAQIGRAVGASWGPSRFDFVADCEIMERDASWLYRFLQWKLKIDHKAFLDDTHYRESLIPQLLSVSGLDLDAVLDYAASYHYSSDSVYFEYVCQYFKSSVQAVEAQNVLAGISLNIANRRQWVKLLTRLLDESNGVEYDKIGCFLQAIASAYRSLEIDEGVSSTHGQMYDKALTVVNVLEGLPGLGINFHELFGVMRLRKGGKTSESNVPAALESKLAENTLPDLLALSAPLDIPADSFYVCVIHKLEQELATSSSKPNYTHFWKWLSKIGDLDKAYGAAVQVGNAFDVSTDRIQMYQCAQTLQARYFARVKSTITDTAALEQVEKMCTHIDSKLEQCIYETKLELALKRHNLESLCTLIKQPRTLMQALYERPESASFRNDILGIYKLDMTRWRSKLALEWFKKDLFPADSCPERTLFLPSMRLPIINCISAGSEQVHEEALLGLLRDEAAVTDDLQLMKRLGQLAQQSQQNTPLSARIRALSLLFQLTKTPGDLQKLKLKRETLLECLVLFLYLLDFQETGVVIQLVEFDNGDKEALVRRLWVQMEMNSAQPSQQRLLLQLIMHILVDYELFKPALWSPLLPLLLQHKAFVDLFTILPFLQAKTSFEFQQKVSFGPICAQLLLSTVQGLPEQLDSVSEPLYVHCVCAPVVLARSTSDGDFLQTDLLASEWFKFASSGRKSPVLMAFGGLFGICTQELLTNFLLDSLGSDNWAWFWHWLETGSISESLQKLGNLVRALCGHLQLSVRETICELILQKNLFELFYPAFQPDVTTGDLSAADYAELLHLLVQYAIETQNISGLLLSACASSQYHLVHELLSMYYNKWDNSVLQKELNLLEEYMKNQQDLDLSKEECESMISGYSFYLNDSA